ncbi:hypothetical protein L6452_36702 [Arctium lappa]|uniref:Uncharacterized protein n=1 Tax=Arctium lappa TaxID=4217 RepID=A0ACB8YA39_ARCLA|nr:hypothetical protein L6452_36702 [Arctium lappa]
MDRVSFNEIGFGNGKARDGTYSKRSLLLANSRFLEKLVDHLNLVEDQEMTSDAKILSFEEVSKHNSKTDCWLIISGKVYDVTPFLDDHPGGDDILILATEKDATEDFEDVGHSQDAKDLMKDYYVGEIDSKSMLQIKSKHKMLSSSDPASNQASGSSSSNILTVLLPILILVLAYALYYFAKKDVVISHH